MEQNKHPSACSIMEAYGLSCIPFHKNWRHDFSNVIIPSHKEPEVHPVDKEDKPGTNEAIAELKEYTTDWDTLSDPVQLGKTWKKRSKGWWAVYKVACHRRYRSNKYRPRPRQTWDEFLLSLKPFAPPLDWAILDDEEQGKLIWESRSPEWKRAYYRVQLRRCKNQLYRGVSQMDIKYLIS
jgi:hypothetical protein